MERLQWTTTHSTADNTMTHIFEHGRILVFVDWNTGKVYTQKDGQTLDCIEAGDMTVDEYQEMLVRLAKEDARLGGFMVD